MLVLALWLPGTFHCQLEAAGLVPAECCPPGESADEDHPLSDAPSHHCEPCSVVEQCGGVQLDPSHELTPIPVWILLSLSDAVLPRPEPDLCIPVPQDIPVGEWSRGWRFALRAAASPRSPSDLLR